MKEQWIQQMQQKLAGYRQPAPEVSWDEIEKALANNRQKAKARMVQLWTRRIAAAVVVLVAVTTGYLALNQQEETITANNVETEVSNKETSPQPKEEKIVAKESVSHKSKMLSVSHKPQVLPTDTLPSEPQPEPEVLQQEEELSVQLAEESSAPHDEDSHTQIANTSPMPLPLDYPTDVRKPAVSGNRLMAKLYLTNGAMKETEHNIPTEIIYRYNYSYIGPDGKPIPDNRNV